MSRARRVESLSKWMLATLVGCLLVSSICGDAQAPAHALPSAPHKFPPYVRGPRYEYVLSEADRESGISYLPAAERLRAVVDKLQRGVNISLVTVGASITAGQGTDYGPMMPRYISNWFADTFPNQVTWSNGGVPGTTSAYLAVCHNIHVPSDADLVIIDFTINDHHRPHGAEFNNDVRRAFERLLRKLLNYPNRPAVILLHSYAWWQAHPFHGSFWSSSEREFGEFERFYHLPSVSTKAAVYHHMYDQLDGFNTTPRTHRTPENLGKNFYFDPIHPDEVTGCRMMAELVYHLITKVQLGLKERPLAVAERARIAGRIPDPMMAGNFESASTRCFIANAFASSVASATGWEWINESKTLRPKWGYISTQPGSEIRLKADTRIASRVEGQVGGEEALVQLGHLKSYTSMGMAAVSCVEGCTCTPSVFDGHHQEQNSLMFFHQFFASPAEQCIILVKVLANTTSGQHKVKLMGLIISEVAGTVAGVDNPVAVEYIADIAMRSKSGKFDMQNHT